jgi:hypothetical protein
MHTLDVSDLPMYPEASDVRVTEQVPLQILTFSCSASPESIITWYRDILDRQGWTIQRVYERFLEVYRLEGENAPAYRIDVFIDPASLEYSSVQLRLLTEYPM